MRISLGVEVLPGKKHSAGEGMPGLWQMLDSLPRSRWPTFARADCGYGSEKIMREFEERSLPYLLPKNSHPGAQFRLDIHAPFPF
ncbi:MAG: transposase [Verrucomicrobiales bacterium]